MAPSVRLRRVGFAAVALASVFLLSACNPSGNVAESFSGLPVAEEAEPIDVDPESGGEVDDASEEEVEGVEWDSDSGQPQVAWWEQGGQIVMVVFGSSTCPTVGQQIRTLEKAGEGNRVAIDLVQRPENEICTMDFVPHTTIFGTPENTTTTKPLNVDVNGEEIVVPVK